MADFSFIANPKVPNAMNTIGSIMDVARGAAALKGQNIANVQNQMYLDQRQAAAALIKSPEFQQSVTMPNGQIDFSKATQQVMSVAPNVGGEVITHLAQSQQAANAANQSFLSLNNQERETVSRAMASIGSDPDTTPASAIDNIGGLVKNLPGLKPWADAYIQSDIIPNLNNPAKMRDSLTRTARQTMAMSQQELPAGGMQQSGVTPSGQPFIQERTPTGQIYS